ncbi:MAG: galactokinase [Bacteroidetes bacterium]|nr:galactokinase [Bacteroidota bacterium]
MTSEIITTEFYKKYSESGESPRIFFSPGRVNLIGEHTDYNGGYVFPCALTYGTYMAARISSTKTIKFASLNFDFTIEIPLSELHNKVGNEWVNYPLGVFNEFKKTGVDPDRGIELLFSGDIPNGAGLSSSASIETVTGFFINKVFGNDKLNLEELALLCQRAENKFIGVNCGIMDQFAVSVGKKDHAIFLNCDTLDHELVPLKLDGLKLVISNTNKKRQLADSKYNERRGECEQAVKYLNKVKKVKNLGELSLDEFNEISAHIPDEVIRKRALHVVSEDQRCVEAVDALKKGDMVRFGVLMNESHDSLRDDYEVTGTELDILVEEARNIKGVLGSRMTGAGFGGCTVSLVREEAVDIFIEKTGKKYEQRTGLKPDFYVADVGDGVKEIQ